MILTLNTQDFAALFLSASLVVSKDATRPHIMGVAMQFENGRLDARYVIMPMRTR